MSDDTVTLTPLDDDLYAPSEACLRYMAEHSFDPAMPVFRAVVSPQFMLKSKAARPEIDNIVQLLVGPFGIVDPRPVSSVYRVAELQVGDNVLNVEAEYD